MNNKINRITKSRLLNNYENVSHGFLNKNSENSLIEIASINNLSGIYILKQVHSNYVQIISYKDINTENEGDSVITNDHGYGIGVYTADCVPILLYDEVKKVIATVHAGWRGTLNGISKNTVMTMKKHYNSKPEDIVSVIGPSIGKCCYEVGAEMVKKFVDKYKEIDSFIYSYSSKYVIDLKGINKEILLKEGLNQIDVISDCTKCDKSYYSYRREGKGVKSQLSFIGLVN